MAIADSDQGKSMDNSKVDSFGIFEEVFHFPADSTGPECILRLLAPTRAATLAWLSQFIATARREDRSLAETLQTTECEHHQVWGSGMALAALLRGLPLANLNVCELGCGLGIGGIAAAVAGAAAVVCTDLPEVLSDNTGLLERSAAANGLGQVIACEALDWAKPAGFRNPPGAMGKGWDVVVGADILYTETHAMLISEVLAQSHILADGGLFIISDSDRGYGGNVVAALQAAGLTVRTQKLHTRVVVTQELGKGQVIYRIDTAIVGSKGPVSPHLLMLEEVLQKLAAQASDRASEARPADASRELKVKISTADIEKILAA